MILRWNKQLVIAYKNSFESPEGKLVLDDLKKHCPLLTESINCSNGIDTNKLVYQEGQRSVLLYIFKMLRRDPNEEAPQKAVNEPDVKL